jgi:hypothetical protein
MIIPELPQALIETRLSRQSLVFAAVFSFVFLDGLGQTFEFALDERLVVALARRMSATL